MIVIARSPGDTEGEDIFGAANLLVVDEQMAAACILHDIGKRAAGTKGGGIRLALHLFEQAFLPGGEIGDVERAAHHALRSGIGHTPAIRRPGRHPVFARIAADLLHRAGRHVHRPDVVIAAAVGGEGDGLAIG